MHEWDGCDRSTRLIGKFHRQAHFVPPSKRDLHDRCRLGTFQRSQHDASPERLRMPLLNVLPRLSTERSAAVPASPWNLPRGPARARAWLLVRHTGLSPLEARSEANKMARTFLHTVETQPKQCKEAIGPEKLGSSLLLLILTTTEGPTNLSIAPCPLQFNINVVLGRIPQKLNQI